MRAIILTTILFALASVGYAFATPKFQCRIVTDIESSTILVFDKAITEVFDDGSVVEYICMGRICLDVYDKTIDQTASKRLEISVLSLNYLAGNEFPATADVGMMVVQLEPNATRREILWYDTTSVTDCRK